MPKDVPCLTEGCERLVRDTSVYGRCRQCCIELGLFRDNPAHCSPVRVRGVTYPSAASAARALGISDSTISKSLRLGTEEHAGLGRRAHRRVPTIPPKPVTLVGKRYSSVAEASRQTGIPYLKLASMFRRSEKSGKPIDPQLILRLLEEGRANLLAGIVQTTTGTRGRRKKDRPVKRRSGPMFTVQEARKGETALDID